MVGFDSQLPTLLLDLFWYAGTVCASYGTALVVGWTVTATDRSDETTVRYLRQLAVSGGMLVALASLAFLLYVGVTDPLYRGLGAAFPTDGGAGRILHLLAMGVICLGVPAEAFLLGVAHVERGVRDLSITSFGIVRNHVTSAVLLAGPPLAFVLLVVELPASIVRSAPFVFVTFAVFYTALVVLWPYVLLLVGRRIPLDEAGRQRVEELCRDVDFRPRAVFQLDGTSTKQADAVVTGTIPGFRYVFVTDYLMDRCDDDQLRAILAHESGHVARRHLWKRCGLRILTVGTWVAVVLDPGSFGISLGSIPAIAALVAALGGVLLFGRRYASRQEYQADDYAGERAGRDEMASALEVLADANDVSTDVNRLDTFLASHPPIDVRIDRLRPSGSP